MDLGLGMGVGLVAVPELLEQIRANRRYEIGFPGATDQSFGHLAAVLTGELLNNVGDPADPGHSRSHTKAIEQQVITVIADLLRAPPARWGYVTTGSTEAVLHAMHEARLRYGDDIVVYASDAAHYCVPKAARLLKLRLVQVSTYATGGMNVAVLRSALAARAHRAAVIVATAGTTMSEAVDDVAAIADVCDVLGITRRRLHVDAALAGIPLALLPDTERPAFDFPSGATSMSLSGHKFLGTLMPCGILIHAGSPDAMGDEHIGYIGAADTTITGSRSGHTPLLLWDVLTRLGHAGLAARARASRDLAAYTHDQLQAIGWPSRRNPHAFTVTLDQPPKTTLDKWALATDGRTAHVICMPGITHDQIDEFIADLRAITNTPRDPPIPLSLSHGLDRS
jgi:histidine decarboxylase